MSGRIVVAAAGSLAAVAIWASLLFAIHLGLAALILNFIILAGLIYLAYNPVVIGNPLLQVA